MSPWFLLLLISLLSVSEARHVKTLPTAIVVGTVYCDTCFQDDFSHHASHSISGATVAVECPDGSFRQQVKTNAHGKFKVHLPCSVSKHANKIKACSVKLVSSSEPYCAVASSATSSSIHLKSRKHGTHIFSAGFFTFKPLKQPSLCNQKSSSPLDFPPPLRDPIGPPELPPLTNILPPLLPPLPVPLPELPPLPPLGSSKAVQVPQSIFPPLLPPLIPNPLQPPPLIPNPLQPPPLIPNPLQPPPPLFPNPFQPPAPLIPNPFQPPPAPLFPNPFQPPPAPPAIPLPFQPPPATPAPIFPFPPIPGFTPSPPPPPPTSLFPPLPLPPLPPLPKIPGVPPASPSSKNNPSP